MNNRESVVSMTDVKSNGTDIEKVWCEGAWYIHDNPCQGFIVETFI